MALDELNLATIEKMWRREIEAATTYRHLAPVIPFFFTVGMSPVIASFIISTIAHFVVGASKALVTTRPWYASGFEMTIVGILEAAVTYGVGVAFAPH